MAFLALALIFMSAWSRSSAVACTGMQTYSVQFQGTYSMTNQPFNFPNQTTKFSPVVLAAHKSAYVMWRTNWTASAGVKQVSMSGMTTIIDSELKAAQAAGNVGNFVIGGGAVNPSTSNATLDITVNSSFTWISLVSMIVPSADWFVGVDSLNMCDTTTGMWKKNVVVMPLAPNDAGAVPNTSVVTTIPCGTYFCNGTGAVPSLATVRINTKMAGMMAACTGSNTVTAMVNTNWTTGSCPPLMNPMNPHFSPLVCAVHSSSYSMWKSGGFATPGVKMVAETGNPAVLQQELMAAKTAGSVWSYSTASGPIGTGVGTATAMVTVNSNFPLVSCILMIAPSPDWFIGVSSYNMCGSNNMWKTMGMSVLKAYDAGTDSGATFTAANMPTNPAVGIGLVAETTPAGCGANGIGMFKYGMNMMMTTMVPKTMMPNTMMPNTTTTLATPTSGAPQRGGMFTLQCVVGFVLGWVVAFRQ